MAKGKKASGKNYTSKGQRPNVTRALVKAVARDREYSHKIAGILRGYDKGQNPWLTVPNPNTNETNKRYIRVRANDLFAGDDNRDNVYKMAGNG